jgi:hypothetical protein
MIDQFYMEEILKIRGEIAKTMFAPFNLIIFSIVVSVTSPTVQKREGFLYAYPLYAPTWL